MNNKNTVKPSSKNQSTNHKRGRPSLAQLKARFSNATSPKRTESAALQITGPSQIEDDLQRAWVETILQNGPHQLMWTFVFKGSYSDQFLSNSMKFVICGLNRKLSGTKEFEKRGQYLKGFFSAEQTRKGRHRGDLHYHLLTKEFPGIPDEIAVERMEDLLTGILPRVVTRDGRWVEIDIDIQLIYHEVGAAAYITKEAGFLETTKGNNIGTIEPRGLLPIELDRFRHRLQG